jgi:hypothetical protein
VDEATMRIVATDYDGHSLGEVDLTRAADGRATLNGQAVVAMRPIGSRVALLAGGQQYCVATADYWRVMGAAGSATAGSAADESM